MNPPASSALGRIVLYRWLLLALLLGAWEAAVHGDQRLIFFFGAPSRVARCLWERTTNGTLILDFGITAGEALAGFVLGNIVGTVLGLGLWHFKTLFQVARPFIVALGAAPVFALAPMLIIWFGTGFFSKVMISGFSTVFIALAQAYSGASEVNPSYLRLMRSLRATQRQTFRKVIAPAALVWVISGFRLNVGFALLGAFIGEFISSNRGLGHLILVASGLFDTPLVFAGIVALAVIALLMNFGVTRMEEPLKRLIARTL